MFHLPPFGEGNTAWKTYKSQAERRVPLEHSSFRGNKHGFLEGLRGGKRKHQGGFHAKEGHHHLATKGKNRNISIF